MKDIIDLSLNQFLYEVSGFEDWTSDTCPPMRIPVSTSKFDPLQTYDYLKKITNNFDPYFVQLTLKRINVYIHNLNVNMQELKNNTDSDHLFFFNNMELDAFKFDQFIELISELESNLKTNQSIKHSNRRDNTNSNIPQKTFVDYLQYKDKAKLLTLLHDLLSCAKPKDFARFIFALRDLYYLDIPTPKTNLYKAMKDEFGEIGATSGMNNYFADNSTSHGIITTSEIESSKKLIEEGLKQ